MCISKKQAKKKKKARIEKKQETKEEKRISPENLFKKINLQSPGWRFFASPAFPETTVYLFLALIQKFGKSDWDELQK